MIKPKVQVFGLDGRYATALYSAASKMKQLDAVEKELVNFQTQMKADPKLKEFVVNPTIKRSIKSGAFKHLASKVRLLSICMNNWLEYNFVQIHNMEDYTSKCCDLLYDLPIGVPIMFEAQLRYKTMFCVLIKSIDCDSAGVFILVPMGYGC